MVKNLICLFRGHEWRTSPFRALNAAPGEYSVRCNRCGKYEHRVAISGKKAGSVPLRHAEAETHHFREAERALLGMRWTSTQADQLINLVEQGRKA